MLLSEFAVPPDVWAAVTLLIGAITLAIRKVVMRKPGSDEQFRSVSLQMLEGIVKSQADLAGAMARLRVSIKNQPCDCCAWRGGRIPDAVKREVDNAILRVKLGHHGEKKDGIDA